MKGLATKGSSGKGKSTKSKGPTLDTIRKWSTSFKGACALVHYSMVFPLEIKKGDDEVFATSLSTHRRLYLVPNDRVMCDDPDDSMIIDDNTFEALRKGATKTNKKVEWRQGQLMRLQ